MSILVTGAAGFIGTHLCLNLLQRKEQVIGVDNLNEYYSVALKQARLALLEKMPGFRFFRADISDESAMSEIFDTCNPVRKVVHLAAQAGVRYSIDNPMAYVRSNLVGQVVILEQCRRTKEFEHLIYASSSSVYGGNTELPFSVEERVDRPVSLYAATKRADELMGYCYIHLYAVPATGLRFFTVYGPWGRPDMAAYLFTQAILEGRPIDLFNNGNMRRDFTYIDDIIDGVVAAIDSIPVADVGSPPHRLYNLGNNQPEPLLRFVEILEKELGQEAKRNLLPLQLGDVTETYAYIETSRRDLDFAPATPIDQGIPKFVAWFKEYHGS